MIPEAELARRKAICDAVATEVRSGRSKTRIQNVDDGKGGQMVLVTPPPGCVFCHHEPVTNGARIGVPLAASHFCVCQSCVDTILACAEMVS